MLVLSRNVGRDETVQIKTPEGRLIVVHVLDWQRGRVRIGFSCDREVEVLRGELVGRGPTEQPLEAQP